MTTTSERRSPLRSAVLASGPDQRAAEIDGCRQAHRRLLDDLDGLTDEQARRPSALPGWTVGHVLTHLARNADSQVFMAEGVLAGEIRDQYPGGAAQRDGDIEAGAGRPAAELVADLRAATAACEDAWARLDDERWASGQVRFTRSGVSPVSYLPISRWREVEVHRGDLGRGATWEDWSPAYVRADLPRLLVFLAADPELLDDTAARRLLAALVGRHDEPVRLPAVY